MSSSCIVISCMQVGYTWHCELLENGVEKRRGLVSSMLNCPESAVTTQE